MAYREFTDVKRRVVKLPNYLDNDPTRVQVPEQGSVYDIPQPIATPPAPVAPRPVTQTSGRFVNRPTRNNNPLNIKVPAAGLEEAKKRYKDPNVTIDPVPATDGGYFLKFSDPNKGFEAASTLLDLGYKSYDIDSALRRWSGGGYGAEIVPELKGKKIGELNPQERLYLVTKMAKREGYAPSGDLPLSEYKQDEAAPDKTTQKVSKFANFAERVDEARKKGKTDTDILESLKEKVPELTGVIDQIRGRYETDSQIKNDRDLVNFMAQKYSKKMPTVESVPLKTEDLGQVEQPEQMAAEEKAAWDMLPEAKPFATYKEGDTLKDVAGKALVNAPASTWNILKGIWDFAGKVSEKISLPNLIKAPTKILDTVQKFAEDPAQGSANIIDSPVKAFDTVLNYLGDRYGLLDPELLQKQQQKGGIYKYLPFDVESFKKVVAEDPIGVAIDLSVISDTLAATRLGKAGAVIKPEARAVARVGEEAGAAAQKLAEGVKGAKEYALSQITGVSPQTLAQVRKTPEAFTKGAAGKYTRETFAQRVIRAVKGRVSDLAATGKEYQVIRDSSEVVKVPKGGAAQVLAKDGIEWNGKNVVVTKESRPLSKGDINAIEDFMKTFGNEQELTANAFLNAREKLSQLSKYSDTTNTTNYIQRQLRSYYDELGKSQLSSLKELDAKFAPEKGLMKEIQKDLFKRDGTLKDNALTILANIGGKGKEGKLARLEKVVPNIKEEASILKALEDIEVAKGQKVGAYWRSAQAAALGYGAFTANVPLIVAAFLAQPSVIIPIIRGYARFSNSVKNLVPAILAKLRAGEKLTEAEKAVVVDAIQRQEFIVQGVLQRARQLGGEIKPTGSKSSDIISEVNKYTEGKVPTDVAKKVEEYARENLATKKEEIFNEALGKDAIVIDPDAIRRRVDGFDELKPEHTALMHEPASEVAKELYTKALEQDKNPRVVFTAGGSGSGKSELVVDSVVNDGYKGIIMDGTLSNYESAIKKIDQAIKAGKMPEVRAILGRIESNWKFVQKRAILEERTINLPDFVDIHTGYVNTLKRLILENKARIYLKDVRDIFKKSQAKIEPFISNRAVIYKKLVELNYDKQKLTERLKKVFLSEKGKRKALIKKKQGT